MLQHFGIFAYFLGVQLGKLVKQLKCFIDLIKKRSFLVFEFNIKTCSQNSLSYLIPNCFLLLLLPMQTFSILIFHFFFMFYFLFFTFIGIGFEMMVSNPLEQCIWCLQFVNIISSNVWRVITWIICNFCLFDDKE